MTCLAVLTILGLLGLSQSVSACKNDGSLEDVTCSQTAKVAGTDSDDSDDDTSNFLQGVHLSSSDDLELSDGSTKSAEIEYVQPEKHSSLKAKRLQYMPAECSTLLDDCGYEMEFNETPSALNMTWAMANVSQDCCQDYGHSRAFCKQAVKEVFADKTELTGGMCHELTAIEDYHLAWETERTLSVPDPNMPEEGDIEEGEEEGGALVEMDSIRSSLYSRSEHDQSSELLNTALEGKNVRRRRGTLPHDKYQHPPWHRRRGVPSRAGYNGCSGCGGTCCGGRHCCHTCTWRFPNTFICTRFR